MHRRGCTARFSSIAAVWRPSARSMTAVLALAALGLVAACETPLSVPQVSSELPAASPSDVAVVASSTTPVDATLPSPPAADGAEPSDAPSSTAPPVDAGAFERVRLLAA